MGETRHEIPRLREAGDHSPGRAVASAGAPDPGEARNSARHLLPLVRSVSSRRTRGAGRQAIKADRVWNRIPDDMRERIIDWRWRARAIATGTGHALHRYASYFVSESSVYRLLKAHDLITSPAFIVMKAADEFKDKTTAPNQLWQTDFTYLKVIGWGWFYLSTILDDFSRYIIAWKLCTTMQADDVTDTLQLALAASGCASARVVHKPRLLSDNGSSYVSGDLAEWLEDAGMGTCAVRPIIPRPRARSSAGTRRSRTASCSTTTTCPAISSPHRSLRRSLQSPALP